MKIAICQVADTGPLESLMVMLRSVGYKCYLPDNRVKQELRRIGCALVLDVDGLVRGWGYDQPEPLPLANLEMMNNADLFVDIKAHTSTPKIVNRWLNLQDKILYYRINGGKPEITIHGDEINLPCPILTPNQWYKEGGPWSEKAYTCWPPFYRFNDYYDSRGRNGFGHRSDPLCLIHNVQGWGYQELVDPMRALGIGCYGVGSPDGLINHSEIPDRLSTALCMIHLKSSDAPGYALYEAMAAACPLVITRRLIWRCNMRELFEPGVNCLIFDRETHDPLSDQDVTDCTKEIQEHLRQLRDPLENRRIGLAGYNRLKEIMWNEERDAENLDKFMKGAFR